MPLTILEKKLATEMQDLYQHIAALEEERNDLEIALTTAIEHGDIIESELEAINERLRAEIGSRQLAESRLKMLVDALISKQKDLEILVDTLIEHGDSVDAQWWQQVCRAEQMAEQDPLTGLLNRRGLDSYLDKQWLLHSNTNQPLAVLLCDIDHFKKYNDSFGHIEGDTCLRRIAAILRNTITREVDVVARFGGEEFLIVLANTPLKGAVSCAERILAALATEKIAHCYPEENSVVSLSIGVISKVPDLSKPFSALLEEADHFLYLAKTQGRNRVCYDETV